MKLITAKKRLLTLLFFSFFLASWGSSGLAAQINSFPYFYDFENETTGPTFSNPTYAMQQPGWLNATGDDMDWTNDVNNTGSGNTGPNLDHTPGAGTFYMYLETSGGGTGRVANLETPTFDFTAAPTPQVSFWYHMYGATTGSLFFEVSTNNGSTWTTIWSRTGQQQTSSNDPWLQAVVNTAAYGGNASVKFRFRGVTGTSFTGDIGLDDFLVENILPDNAGISAMVSPVPGASAGTYAVDVTLENFGSNVLNSADIEWEVNGVAQTSTAFTGPAIAAFGNTTVNLSAATAFASGLTTLRFWTKNPNGTTDSDPGNDTLTTLFCTGLAGTYTVGTAASDFLTIPDAVNALYNCGIGGAVTFEVQAGNYTTPIVLNQAITGSSATNTVTWDGLAQGATITVASGAVVTLEEVDYVTIQNFVLANTNTTTAWGVILTNGADYNSILNNRVVMAPSTAFNTAGIVSTGSTASVSTNGNNANHTLIEGNTITGSDRGISLRGPSTTNYNVGNVIRNNDISNADNYGVYTYYQDSCIVEGNTIYNFPSTFHYGIYCWYTDNFKVESNDVQAVDYGIYMSRSNSQTGSVVTSPSSVANNMVQTEDDRGIYMLTTRSTNFYHNTVRTADASACVWSNFDNTVDVKNNIFVSNATNSYAFETFTNDDFLGLDYNLFYKDPANTSIIRYSGTLYADLADWQANNPNGYGANSIEGLPTFVGPTDLHVDGPLIDNQGVLTNIIVDIDGDVRPAAGSASVDIGADEFTPPQNDAGVAALISPTLPITAGFSSIEINVRNYGTSILSTFDVSWQINSNTPITTTYTGAPIQVGGTANMILANVNLPANTTELTFWTENPNGVLDERLSNDTLVVNLCAGLAGTYSVGTPISDFPTIDAAITALEECGVNGAIVFEVAAGVYNGPIVLGEIAGVNAINTVTFDGYNRSDATLTHDGTGLNTGATITLNGADYITFKNFTIENTGTTLGYGVLLINEANYNTIEDNDITVSVVSSSANVVGVLSSASFIASNPGTGTEGNNANYTMIRNNEITGGNSGITLEGGIPDVENLNNKVYNNEIHDCFNFAIYADEQDSLMLVGNEIYGLGSNNADAVQLFDIRNFTIRENNIVSRDYGLAIFGGFSASDKSRDGLIANNMIETGASGEALYLRDVIATLIYHNTFNAGLRAVWLDNQANIDFRNNIMATGTGTCFYTFDAVSMSGMDNNLYYISGSGDAVRFGTTTYPTLLDWQTTGAAGYDANSVSGNPNFVNGLFVSGTLAIDTADPNLVVPITYDINGDPRPLGVRPDIGADEHLIIANDVMAVEVVSPDGCGQANHDIIVAIANVGSNLLVSVPITVNVTGDATATFVTSQQNLVPGVTINNNIGSINTAAGGTFNIEVIVNLGNDGNRTNDTINTVVTINPNNQNALTMTGDTIVCTGSTAMVSTVASYAPSTIMWYDAPVGGNLITMGNGFTTMPLTATTSYYAEIRGCSSPRAVATVLVDNIGIDVDLGPDLTACGGSIAEIIPTITNSTATKIEWQDGALTTNYTASSTGDYYATVTNANGCTDTDTVNVAVSPMPAIANVTNNVSCGSASDGAIDLTVTGGTGSFSYAWSTSATTADITGLAGGFYVVTIVDNGTA
ncbi:MAG: right-handed parallel beta-helix repeat-containing protein, partial [Aureispira sp.]